MSGACRLLTAFDAGGKRGWWLGFWECSALAESIVVVAAPPFGRSNEQITFTIMRCSPSPVATRASAVYGSGDGFVGESLTSPLLSGVDMAFGGVRRPEQRQWRLGRAGESLRLATNASACGCSRAPSPIQLWWLRLHLSNTDGSQTTRAGACAGSPLVCVEPSGDQVRQRAVTLTIRVSLPLAWSLVDPVRGSASVRSRLGYGRPGLTDRVIRLSSLRAECI